MLITPLQLDILRREPLALIMAVGRSAADIPTGRWRVRLSWKRVVRLCGLGVWVAGFASQ
jgi:hypothetical protein